MQFTSLSFFIYEFFLLPPWLFKTSELRKIGLFPTFFTRYVNYILYKWFFAVLQILNKLTEREERWCWKSHCNFLFEKKNDFFPSSWFMIISWWWWSEEELISDCKDSFFALKSVPVFNQYFSLYLVIVVVFFINFCHFRL